MSNKLIVPQSNLPAMSADEARHVVESINGTMENVRAQLYELYVRRGWEALGYASWRECAIAEFGQSKSEIYRQIEAAEVEQEISPEGLVGQIPESHLRPLAQLPAGTRAEVFREAQDTAPEGKLTAKHIEQVVAKYQPDKPPRKQKPVPELPPAEQSQSSKTELQEFPAPAATESVNVPESVPTPDLSSPRSPLNLYMVTSGTTVWFVSARDEAQVKKLVNDPFMDVVLVDMTEARILWSKNLEAPAPQPEPRPMATPTVKHEPPPPPPLAKGQPARSGFAMPRTPEENAEYLKGLKERMNSGR